MEKAITGLGIVVGIIIGAGGMFMYLYEPMPEIGQQNAQGCLVDGFTRHADGTFRNNWVCFDPNE